MSDDAQLLLADQRARTVALDVSRSFIVQAPAGSGKTELLIQRYLKLLSCVRSPEEILAITFTRKAAIEMQTRINAALLDATQGVHSADAHRRHTIELASTAIRRDKEFGWRLVESPRRMRIQTLDSFCAGLGNALPVSSGLGRTLTTLADAEMHAIYRHAAAATLDWLLSDEHSAEAVTRLLAHLDNNTKSYIDHLARMLETRDQWIGLIGSGTAQESLVTGAARRRLEANIESFISAQLENLLNEFQPEFREELLPLLRYAADTVVQQGNAAHAMTACRGITGFPGSAVRDLPGWRAIAGLLLKQDGEWRKSVNKNDGFPPKDAGEKKRLQEILAAMSAGDELRVRLHRARLLPDSSYSDAQWDVLLALFNLLPLALVELRRIFGERAVCDHTEVALAANMALGDADQPGDIALLLDYSIQHILVDEMQDTSIGQYQLIAKLTGGWTDGDGKTLFCVGDPMQSIYRFRNAEVGRFVQIRESGIGSLALESLVLHRNFRSGENLVHWFNTIFSQVFPLRDDISAGAICYSESVPVESWRGLGEWQVHPLFGASAEEEADVGIEVLQQCLDSSSDQTTAVLVRSRSQLPALLRRLRDAGREYRAIEIDRLTDLPEIIDVLALTRAMCHDGDRLAWLALLRGPWVGLPWTDLHRLVVNDSSSTVRELMADPDRTATLSPDTRHRLKCLSDFLAAHFVRRRAESLRDRVEIAWYALGGPALLQNRQQLENVYRYLDVLEKIETAGALIDIADLESRLDDERVSSFVDNPRALQVMTMHKAKGLEFDNVVLYALGRSTRGKTKSIMSWMSLPDSRSNFEILLSPIGARAELEHDKLHQCIEAVETDKEKHELDRLLYVACSRARRTLHLIGSVPLNAERDSFRSPPVGSLLGRLWPAVEQEYARAFATGKRIYEGSSGDQARLKMPQYRRFRTTFAAPLPPELPVSARVIHGGETIHDIEFYWVGIAARHAGTIVHKWLKRFSQNPSMTDAGVVSTLRPATARMAVELGVPEKVFEHVCNRVESSLLGVLRDPRGQWLISGDGHSELALSGLWHDQTVSIIIDRVRIDDGIHWIVDYKTSSHEGGDVARFLDQESLRYRQQLERYAVLYRRMVTAPVRTALYFPLLQEFREVALNL